MKILIYGSDGWIGGQVCMGLDKLKITYIKGKNRSEDIEGLENEILTLNIFFL
jgi:nucleoside-diphosphate-sugar epimerase